MPVLACAALAAAVLVAPRSLPLDTRAENGTVRVGAVQGNVATDFEDAFNRALEVTSNHAKATKQLATDVRTILREGEAERINDWTIRFTHDDYRVDVNTASAEIITVIDEYDADYNEAAQASLAQGEYTSLNALELEFSERARTFLKKTPPFVFDLMLQALSSPESVRMAEGWTRIYAAQGLEIAVSPDERTVLALAKTPDFHVLHAENLRKVQLEELSNTLAKQAEDKAARAENTTEEEK